MENNINADAANKDHDEQFKQWSDLKFSRLTGNVTINYDGNTNYALARYVFSEAMSIQAAKIAELEALVAKLKVDAYNNEGMAGCMDMFRHDMINAGVIEKSVPPMFMTEGILNALNRARKGEPLIAEKTAVATPG